MTSITLCHPLSLFSIMKKKTFFTICAFALTSLFGFSCFASSSFYDHAAKEVKAETTERYANVKIRSDYIVGSTVLTDFNQTQAYVGSGSRDILLSTGNRGFYLSFNFNFSDKAYLNTISLYAGGTSYSILSSTYRYGGYIYLNVDNMIYSWGINPPTEYGYYDMTDVFYSIFEEVNLNSSFTFNEQINYYAPYQNTISSDFVNDASMVNSASSKTIDIVSNRWFLSGGKLFNSISLVYVSAEALSYINSNGDVETWSASGYASYLYMQYKNSLTNDVEIVNQRNRESYNNNGGYGYYQIKSSNWISSNFKTIDFIFGGDDVLNTDLNKLNNATTIPVVFVDSNDIGLGAFFTVMSSAFASMVNILSISIFPGVTLGLLLFTPLIVGIIIAIVWIVKR